MSKEADKFIHIYSTELIEGDCAASVHDTGRGVGFHQCCRKGKYSYDYKGKTYYFCKTHHPQTQLEKHEADMREIDEDMTLRLSG